MEKVYEDAIIAYNKLWIKCDNENRPFIPSEKLASSFISALQQVIKGKECSGSYSTELDRFEIFIPDNDCFITEIVSCIKLPHWGLHIADKDDVILAEIGIQAFGIHIQSIDHLCLKTFIEECGLQVLATNKQIAIAELNETIRQINEIFKV